MEFRVTKDDTTLPIIHIFFVQQSLLLPPIFRLQLLRLANNMIDFTSFFFNFLTHLWSISEKSTSIIIWTKFYNSWKMLTKIPTQLLELVLIHFLKISFHSIYYYPSIKHIYNRNWIILSFQPYVPHFSKLVGHILLVWFELFQQNFSNISRGSCNEMHAQCFMRFNYFINHS